MKILINNLILSSFFVGSLALANPTEEISGISGNIDGVKFQVIKQPNIEVNIAEITQDSKYYYLKSLVEDTGDNIIEIDRVTRFLLSYDYKTEEVIKLTYYTSQQRPYSIPLSKNVAKKLLMTVKNFMSSEDVARCTLKIILDRETKSLKSVINYCDPLASADDEVPVG